VDGFVDPTLHRNRVSWDDLDEPVPAALRAVAEAAWERLQPLAADGDTPATLTALDDSRAAYGTLYGEAEAIAQSSVLAARPRRKRAQPAATPAPTLYVRLARRVPARYRKRVRRLLRA
jgi:hypothetical protein